MSPRLRSRSRDRARPGRSTHLPTAIGLVLAASLGCQKEQAAPRAEDAPTDNPSLTDDPYRCAETEAPLAATDDSGLGYSVQSAFDRVTSERSVSLSWQPGEQTYGPESAESGATVRVTETSGARFVDSRLEVRDGWAIPDDVTEESLGCRDVLRFDGTLHLASDGGALAEAVPATFEVGTEGIPTATVRLPLASLGGSFSAELSLPTGFQMADAPRLRVGLGFSDSTTAGDVWLESGELIGDDQARTRGVSERIAHFPTGTACGPEHDDVSRDQLVRRTAMAEALLQLNAMSPTRVTGEVGTQDADLTLSFRNADDTVCLDTNTPVDSALVFPCLVDLDSGDQRIEGSLQLDVVALAELGRVTASGNALSDDPSALSSVLSSFGIHDPVELSGYGASSAEAQFGTTADGSFGTLRAYGLTTQGCDAEAEPVNADAGAPASCGPEGRTQVWGIHWGTPPQD